MHMPSRHRLARRAGAFSGALVLAVVAFGATAGIASASTASASASAGNAIAKVSKTAAITPRVIQVPMTLNCATLTSKEHGYAVSHGYCKASSGGISPDDVVTGNCGSSEIDVYDEGGGFGDVVYGFNSTLGIVIYRSLYVSGTGGLANPSWNDDGPMGATGYYAGNDVFFGVGNAAVTMSGSVQLAWGPSCTLLQPFAITGIS